MSTLPFSIYRYASAAEFLGDAYESRRASDPTFSYEFIAGRCGFKSRTYARKLIKGAKDASASDLTQLAEVFKLSPIEARYLVDLSAFQSSGGGRVAQELFSRLIELQKKHAPEARPFREIETATSLLHMTLLSVCDLPTGPTTPAAMAVFLKNRFLISEIESALQDLLASGFLNLDAISGRLRSSEKHLKKYDFNANYFLRKFHRDSLALAEHALENESTSERYLVGSSFSVNAKVYPRIVQKLNAFIEQLMTLEGVAGDTDTVVQINFQLLKMGAVASENLEPGLSGPMSKECVLSETENPVIAGESGDLSRISGVL